MPTPPRKTTPPTPRRTTAPGQRDSVRPKRIARQPARRSFLARNQSRLVAVAITAAVVFLGALAYLNATSPVYACASEWTAPATPAPAPSASPRYGYVQGDLGRSHVDPGTFVRYLACPPASGRHFNAGGLGPIQAKLYGPDDATVPQGWIHNMEHGGLVLLYKCPGEACTDPGQAALRQFFQGFPSSPICHLPPGAIGPVIARFDQMQYPYAAMLWDQVLPLQTLDTQQILAFFNQQAERTNPEKQPQCTAASPSPGATAAPTLAPTVTPTSIPSTPASTSPSTSPAAS